MLNETINLDPYPKEEKLNLYKQGGLTRKVHKILKGYATGSDYSIAKLICNLVLYAAKNGIFRKIMK
jgi:hypothetical protein